MSECVNIYIFILTCLLGKRRRRTSWIVVHLLIGIVKLKANRIRAEQQRRAASRKANDDRRPGSHRTHPSSRFLVSFAVSLTLGSRSRPLSSTSRHALTLGHILPLGPEAVCRDPRRTRDVSTNTGTQYDYLDSKTQDG